MRFEQINLILSEWDPIGVGYPLAANEYKGYIPRILSAMNNKEELEMCLVSILEDMGLDYNPSMSLQKKDLQSVIDKILAV